MVVNSFNINSLNKIKLKIKRIGYFYRMSYKDNDLVICKFARKDIFNSLVFKISYISKAYYSMYNKQTE